MTGSGARSPAHAAGTGAHGVDAGALGASLAGQSRRARALRRTLHADPRLSGFEQPTLDTLLTAVGAGAQVTRLSATSAVVRVGGPGPAIAVRAELDALPIPEETGVAWASNNGAMHACGHDVHMAAAVALAWAVGSVPGAPPVLLILQPREEANPSGALDVIDSGVLTAESVIAMLGVHVQPLIDVGAVACSPGVVNASADEFTVTVRGQGGHAAYPHLGADPLLALAHFIVAVQQLVARETDPMTAAVVSVCAVRGGESSNVRPDRAVARGTVRAMSADHRSLLLKRLEAVAEGIAAASGCEAVVEFSNGEPVLNNDPLLAEVTRARLQEVGLRASSDLRSCGADDFAYYGAEVPSLMMFLGTGAHSGKLHSASFLPPADSVELAARALLAGYLGAAHAGGPMPGATDG